MPITVKQIGPSGYAVGRALTSEAFFLNNANTSGANAVGESVNSMLISELMWVGDWTISRGANLVFDTASSGHGGHLDFQASGMRLESNIGEEQSNCVCTLTGAGSLIIKFHKKSSQA